MYYLIAQYGGWLAMAFILGLFVGWLTCSDEADRRWGWLWPALFAAVAGLIVTLWRVVNGVPALWLETALLFFGFYIAGCCIACLIRPVFLRPPVAEGVRSWHENRGEAGPKLSPAPSVLPEPGVRNWHRDLSQDKAAQSASVAPVADAPARAAAPAPMPRVEGEDQIAGVRPPGLMEPRDGKADDLKLIKGIGKQNEGRLHGLGIWHFDQIAGWSKENVEWVGAYLAFPGRIEREDWVNQAKVLATGAETEFAKRARRGEVATSRDDGSRGQDNVVPIAPEGSGDARPANPPSGSGKGDAS